MKIAILIANAYGMGGTIRTVFNLAAGLSARNEVEIISLGGQRQKKPFFTPPEGVTITPLLSRGTTDSRYQQSWFGRWRERRYGGAIPSSEAKRNRFLDGATAQALRTYLRTTDADVVMGTRPAINLMIARWAPSRVLRIGQEHIHLDKHADDLRSAIGRYYRRLDGIVVLTDADRRSYRRLLKGPMGWITTIPNSLPEGDYPRSSQDNPIIAAAGRITKLKQYPKLLNAFAVVARKHPEWQLRIYGGGKDETKDEKLRAKIVKMGLSNQVALMGRTKDLTGELAKASLLAVSSSAEGFGMTIIEGFSVGLPAVSFNCPHGPYEIIDHEHNGLLIPMQDVDALAAGMLRLVENTEERKRMSEAAAQAAANYNVTRITRRWEEFLNERLAVKTSSKGAIDAA